MKPHISASKPRGLKRRAVSATLAATFVLAGVAGTQVELAGPASARPTVVFDCFEFLGLVWCVPTHTEDL